MMKTLVIALLSAAFLVVGCGKKVEPVAPPAPVKSAVHNLTPDEVTRAQVNAQAYFNGEFPAGTNAKGDLVRKKGSWTSCRPQDSNNNGLVTCTGMVPNMEGGYAASTMYCGYNGGAEAISGCNDKDQK